MGITRCAALVWCGVMVLEFISEKCNVAFVLSDSLSNRGVVVVVVVVVVVSQGIPWRTLTIPR